MIHTGIGVLEERRDVAETDSLEVNLGPNGWLASG